MQGVEHKKCVPLDASKRVWPFEFEPQAVSLGSALWVVQCSMGCAVLYGLGSDLWVGQCSVAWAVLQRLLPLTLGPFSTYNIDARKALDSSSWLLFKKVPGRILLISRMRNLSDRKCFLTAQARLHQGLKACFVFGPIPIPKFSSSTKELHDPDGLSPE